MKYVAKTLTEMLEDPIVSRILDRTEPCLDLVPEVLGYWSYDMMTRSFGAGLGGVCKNLDMTTALMTLSDMNIPINIPEYKRATKKIIKSDEMVVSKSNRHGQIKSLGANMETFSFHIKMDDQNVMTEGGTGAPRNFSLTTPEGNWYEGWSELQFMPPKDLKRKLTEESQSGRMTLQHFVHPNRWISYYGKYYMRTKILLQRLEEEKEWLKYVLDWIKYWHPEVAKSATTWVDPEDQVTYEYGESKRIQVPTFESMYFVPNLLPHPVALYWPKMKSPSAWNKLKKKTFDNREEEFFAKCSSLIGAYRGEEDAPWYPMPSVSTENYQSIRDMKKHITFTLIPKLRFVCRSIEYAFDKYGVNSDGKTSYPAWVKGTTWKPGFTLPKLDRKVEGFKATAKKKEYDRLIIVQPKVGDFGISLMHRKGTKSVEVDIDYEEK